MDLLNSILGGVGQAGEALDKFTGGRALRGLAGGHPRELLSVLPFSDTSGLTDERDRMSGRDVTDAWGLTGKNDSGWGATGTGFAADMLLNPLSLAGAGMAAKAAPTVGKGLLAGAKSLSGADLLESLGGKLGGVGRLAADESGALRWPFGEHMVTPSEVPGTGPFDLAKPAHTKRARAAYEAAKPVPGPAPEPYARETPRRANLARSGAETPYREPVIPPGSGDEYDLMRGLGVPLEDMPRAQPSYGEIPLVEPPQPPRAIPAIESPRAPLALEHAVKPPPRPPIAIGPPKPKGEIPLTESPQSPRVFPALESPRAPLSLEYAVQPPPAAPIALGPPSPKGPVDFTRHQPRSPGRLTSPAPKSDLVRYEPGQADFGYVPERSRRIPVGQGPATPGHLVSPGSAPGNEILEALQPKSPWGQFAAYEPWLHGAAGAAGGAAMDPDNPMRGAAIGGLVGSVGTGSLLKMLRPATGELAGELGAMGDLRGLAARGHTPPNPIDLAARSKPGLNAESHSMSPRRFSEDPAKKEWYAKHRTERTGNPDSLLRRIQQLGPEDTGAMGRSEDVYALASQQAAAKAAREAPPQMFGQRIEPTSGGKYNLKPGPIPRRPAWHGPASEGTVSASAEFSPEEIARGIESAAMPAAPPTEAPLPSLASEPRTFERALAGHPTGTEARIPSRRSPVPSTLLGALEGVGNSVIGHPLLAAGGIAGGFGGLGLAGYLAGQQQAEQERGMALDELLRQANEKELEAQYLHGAPLLQRLPGGGW